MVAQYAVTVCLNAASQILDAALPCVNPAQKSLEIRQSPAFFVPDVLKGRTAHDVFDRIQAVLHSATILSVRSTTHRSLMRRASLNG